MQGYDVVTSDGEAVGTVVEETKASLVVEHGLLRKSRRAIPRAFAHVDEARARTAAASADCTSVQACCASPNGLPS